MLQAIDRQLGISKALGELVPDHRDPSRVVHGRVEQVRQRLLQIAQGYEDCNDADTLRTDPALKLACLGHADEDRALSSQPSLSRFENAPEPRDIAKMLNWFEKSWIDGLAPKTDLVVLDVDSTDDPTHGRQQLSVFHGFYDQHMYHPLLVFDGLTGQLVTGLLRPGTVHACRGAGRLRRIIELVKTRFPNAHVLVRGDSAFANLRLMHMLDDLYGRHDKVEYAFGLARNAVLERMLAAELAAAKADHEATGRTIQRFTSLSYAAKSWTARRRVIGKAEWGPKGDNPRFLVTSLADDTPEAIYRWYCERGQVENDIKNLKRGLSADRLSCCDFKANFFRLILHMAAYRLMFALRQKAAPHHAELARAEFGTLRLRLLKVAALVTQSVRRVLVRLP